MQVCYLRDDDRVFETYWTTGRGCELMGSSYAMLDTTVYGRQEAWEDSPEGYPQTKPYTWWNWHDNYAAEPTPHPEWVEITT